MDCGKREYAFKQLSPYRGDIKISSEQKRNGDC
jgi:hypothetical protein